MTNNAPSSDIGEIRDLLTTAFDDVQLDSFCMDCYPEVYDRFTRGMTKDEKINWLLDPARRRGELASLLDTILAWQKEKPYPKLKSLLARTRKALGHRKWQVVGVFIIIGILACVAVIPTLSQILVNLLPTALRSDISFLLPAASRTDISLECLRPLTVAAGPREVATDIDWISDYGKLVRRCEFDFARPHDDWPHASYYVDMSNAMQDWTRFDLLTFDAKRLVDSNYVRKVTIALATGPGYCWNELEDFQVVGQQWERRTFNLDQPRWKTCSGEHGELGKSDIRRLYVIVIVDSEDPQGPPLSGSILIDNMALIGR
ncbi:MAG: hypothetical protein ACFFA6_15370 [Promethearchaeota archaeon]